MTGDWEKAIEFVLRMEGGAAGEKDPNDPGGYTKFGISTKSYPRLDIKNLTLDQAKEIYRRDFWNDCHCDELPSRFSLIVFDTAVNMGQGTARRLLQMTLDVEVDGIIGQQTVSAAFMASPRRAMKYLAFRQAEYDRRILANPKLLVYAVNWSFRVLSLFETASKETV